MAITAITSASQCRQALAEVPAACAALDFARGDRVELARTPIDDGVSPDLFVRRLTLFDCGTEGCSTRVYLRSGHRLVEARPPLVTRGSPRRCKLRGKLGLVFTGSRGRGPCFVFTIE